MVAAVLTGGVVIFLGIGSLPLWAVLVLGGLSALLGFQFGRHTHGHVMAFDGYARRSRLALWNPALKVWISLIWLFLCIGSRSALPPVVLLLVLSGAVLLGGGVKLHEYLALLYLPAVFLLLSALTLLWDYAPAPEGVLSVPFLGGWLTVTPAAQENTRLILARALGAVSCLYFLSLSTTVPQILSVLRRARVPAVIVELAVLMYRYIFLLLSVYRDMRNAAASRLGYTGLRQSLRTTGAVYGNLLANSLRRARSCFDAMESRCWEGEIRFLEDAVPIRLRHLLPAGGITAAMVAAVCVMR